MLMLENMRFASGETANDPRVAAALAELADVVCTGGGICLPFLSIRLDIGPETADRYAAEIDAAATTVVGGRETVQALPGYGLQDRVSHLSTGGDATLKLLEGRGLPGLQALRSVTVRA
jgi:3-phosphoglycerate kinase